MEKFSDLSAALAHEREALQARRQTWANLTTAEQQAFGSHVTAEHVATREAVQADGEETRSELRELKPILEGLSAEAQGKKDRQQKSAERRRQQEAALAQQVEAGGGTSLEQLLDRQRRAQTEVTAVSDILGAVRRKMRENKADGHKCTVCGSLEGEMMPYIGKRLLGPC